MMDQHNYVTDEVDLDFDVPEVINKKPKPTKSKKTVLRLPDNHNETGIEVTATEYERSQETFKFTYKGIILSKYKYIFINGKAGVGKSQWIKALVRESGNRITTCAPTGVAAYSINTKTLHSVFKLKPEAQFDTEIQLLTYYNKIKVNKINIPPSTEILLIDEAYMMSASVFKTILLSLSLFNYNIKKFMFVGDIKQLPSIDIPFNVGYADMFNEDNTVRYDLIPVNKFLPNFVPRLTPEYESELEFFRDDNEYNGTKILSKLNEMVKYTDMFSETPFDEDAITVCYRNRDVDVINRSRSNIRLYIYNSNKYYLCDPGSKVIVTKNVNVSVGLFNGAFMTLNRMTLIDLQNDKKYLIDTKTPYTLIETVHKVIDNDVSYKNKYELEYTFTKHDNEEITYRGKKMSFEPAYAITIHKVQGLTINKLNLKLYNNDFWSEDIKALLYVALSRVRNPKDLYIEINN